MKRLTCGHDNPLAEPCEACSAEMSTPQRLEITSERMAHLAARRIPTRYARAEWDALTLRLAAELIANNETASAGGTAPAA